MSSRDHALMMYYAPNSSTVKVLNENRAFLASNPVREGRARFFSRDNYQPYEEVLDRAKYLKRRVQHILDDDIIYHADNIGATQQAKPKMRNIIMSNPLIRRLYQREMLEGYGDMYRDPEPDYEAEFTKPYRQAMHGVIVKNEEGIEECTQWFDLEEDEILSLDDQCEIHATWTTVCNLIMQGLNDPTDPYNKIM